MPLSAFVPVKVDSTWPDDLKAPSHPDRLDSHRTLIYSTIGFGILDTKFRYVSINNPAADRDQPNSGRTRTYWQKRP